MYRTIVPKLPRGEVLRVRAVPLRDGDRLRAAHAPAESRVAVHGAVQWSDVRWGGVGWSGV